MKKQRRTFSKTFKQNLVKDVVTGAISVVKAAKKFNIHRSVIERWKKELEKDIATSKIVLKEKIKTESPKSDLLRKSLVDRFEKSLIGKNEEDLYDLHLTMLENGV